jgi:hypothetical protein
MLRALTARQASDQNHLELHGIQVTPPLLTGLIVTFARLTTDRAFDVIVCID